MLTTIKHKIYKSPLLLKMDSDCIVLRDGFIPKLASPSYMLGGKSIEYKSVNTAITFHVPTDAGYKELMCFFMEIREKSDDYFILPLKVFNKEQKYLVRIFGELTDNKTTITANVEIWCDWDCKFKETT